MVTQKLSVLHINKYHYHRDGAANVYLNTARLLEEKGHRPVFFSMHNPNNLKKCETAEYFMPYADLSDENISLVDKAMIAGRILYSFKAKRLLSALLDKYSVDIAHIHNIYHHISPSILHELKRRKIPVVMTLHDYKLVCGSYSMITDGMPCNDCSRKKYFMTIKNRCVKGSLFKSILTALEMYFHHVVLDIYNNVDVFISPSLFLASKLKEMGFDKKIVHLPNFIDIRAFQDIPSEKKLKEDSVVYFGRLSGEKGLMTLIKTAKILLLRGKKIEIKIVGEGPMKNDLQEKAVSENVKNVRFISFKKNEDLFQEVTKSIAVVLPSEWYENNPISVLEAFALGLPVIGAKTGGIPELIKDNITGLTFEPGNSEELSSKIEYMADNRSNADAMGKSASAFVNSEMNAEKHYEKLMDIYRTALGAVK